MAIQTERVESDAALLARVAAGDERAFESVYGAHRARLYRVAYGVLLDPHEAREAVQEAFLQLHRAAPRWEPRAAVGTWLHRVVLNHCLGLKPRLLRLAKPIFNPRPPMTPEHEATLTEAMRVVEKTLARLPMKQRAVATLYLESELSPADIASLLDMTPNHARVTLHRALEELRTALTAAGIDTPHEEVS